MDCQKHLFNLDPEVTYLNCAFMSPLMKSVEKAGIEGIQKKLSPWNITGNEFFEETNELRSEYSKLINCPDPERIVVIPSVSYGMANVAQNIKLGPEDEIIVINEQFPSNVYPWRRIVEESGARIVTVRPPQTTENRGRLWNEYILNTISKDTKLVACGHIHWADGTLFDLKAIREKTWEVGALLVIDGTQSIGAVPFDIQDIQPDALIAAGYKSMMGPYSIGLAYYGTAFDNGIPVEENWINRYESENFTNLVNYNDQYQPGALRYEVGEHSNFILIPMMLEALKVLNSWGADQVKKYCDNLVAEPISKLREIGFIIEHENYRASNLFGIRLGRQHVMDHLQARLQESGIVVSYRGDSIRVSPNIYNDSADFDKLVRALTD